MTPFKTCFLKGFRRGLLLSLVGLPIIALGHARIDPASDITPRNNNSGLKSGPCGNVPATDDPALRTTLIAGSVVEFKWEETINHPGFYRISFSPDGETGFEQNVLIDNITDLQNGRVNFNDPNTYHKYSVELTVPEQLCETCALQLIQVMTDRNPPTNYYSCADIRIVAAPPEGEAPATPIGLKVEMKTAE